MTNINLIKAKGIFENTSHTPQYITDSGKTLLMATNAKDTKDPLFFIIDLSGVTGSGIKLIMRNKEISLTSGKINIIPVTTEKLKNQKGTIDFRITSDSVTFDASMKISVNVLSYTPVINH